MDKNTKKFLIGVGILVFFVIILTIYSSFSKNYDIASTFVAGVFITIIVYAIVVEIRDYIIGIQNLKEKKREVEQVKVALKKPLPIYFKSLIYGCEAFLAANLLILIIMAMIPSIDFNLSSIIIFGELAVILIAVVVLFIKIRPKKMLYLIENDERVSKYTSNLDKDMKIFDLCNKICNNKDEYFINKKCEKIKLYNGIELYSCFSKYSNYLHSEYGRSSYYRYIFAIYTYNNIGDFDIEINERLYSYLNKDNIYIPRYSNLPPFIISGEMAESVCQKIEEICSEFFSKTRFCNVLIINHGKIGLGLSSARFGICNRIFDKNKTIAQTKEAIREIEEFLLQLRSILDS